MIDKKKNGTFILTLRPRIVKKGWGHEIIFHNDDDYCGKILRFNKGGEFSMHYHIDKRESWFLVKGKMIFKFIDPKTAEIKETIFWAGQTIIINRGMVHQLVALEESDIYEVSTPDNPEDSYRVMKGDSQK
jgi:mannose-6-phosphate isomerase-like protein (cupin superfamily)